MIDFSTLKGLSIPEGVVKQITDANGRVLWSASKPVNIHVTRNPAFSTDSTYANIAINGQVYDGSVDADVTVDAGSVIRCYVQTNTAGRGGITVYGEGVTGSLAANSSATYDFIANADATITVSVLSVMTMKAGSVDIAES